MQNIISSNNANSMNIFSTHKKQEGSSLNSSQTEKSPLSTDKNQLLINKEEKEKEEKEAKKTNESTLGSPGNYHDLINRVAENEAKKANLSTYNQSQQHLLKQVEKNISPMDERSYDFKV